MFKINNKHTRTGFLSAFSNIFDQNLYLFLNVFHVDIQRKYPDRVGLERRH